MATSYFIDFNRGSDSNAGTSTGAPWKTLAKITNTASLGPGDQVLLADDSEFDLAIADRVVPQNNWTGTLANPVIIGKYSPSSQSVGNKPVIRWNIQTAPSDWTYDGAKNGWIYTHPTAHINAQCLVRLGDTWDAHCPDQTVNAAVASIDGRWNVGQSASSNDRIILWAPADTNPVTYYGGVLISPAAVGAITLSSGRGAITVENILFERTGCGVSMYSGTTAAANFVARCLSGRICSGLVYASGDTSGVLKAWVLDCDLWDFGSTGLQAYAVGGAGIAYLEIARNRLGNGGHGNSQAAIYLQVRNSARDVITHVHHNWVTGYRWGTRDKGYDGSAIYCETGSDGVLVYANVAERMYCAYQDNSGRRNRWMGNVAAECRLGMRIGDQQNNNQSDTYLYNNTFLIGALSQQPTEWGASQGAEYPGVWMYKSTGGNLNVTAANNIVANIGAGTARAAFGLPDNAGTMTLNGNWLYGFGADTMVASSNSSAGSLTNVGTSDPRPYLMADGALKIAPTTTWGTLSSDNPLATTGAYVEGVKLINGRLRPGACPVGAYAAVLPGTARTA